MYTENNKKMAELVNAESKRNSEIIRQRRAKEIAEKRASIEKRRQKVTKLIEKKERNSLSVAKVDVPSSIPTFAFVIDTTDNQPMDLTSENTTDNQPLDSTSENTVLGIKMSEKNENDSEVIETDESEDKLSQIKMSSHWFNHKKSIFDKASSVYLESKNAKDLIQRRNLEELAKKREKVLSRRKELSLAKEKRDSGMSETLVEMIEEDEQESSDTADVTGSDEYDTGSESSFSDEYDNDSDYDDLAYQIKWLYENDNIINGYIQEQNNKNNSANNDEDLIKDIKPDINKMNQIKKEINNAYMILKACKKLSCELNDVPIEIQRLRKKIHKQREERRRSVEMLRRQRCEEAKRVREDSRLAQEIVSATRNLESWKRRRAVDKTKQSKNPRPSQIKIKPSNWTQEREIIKQNVAAKIEQEIYNLQSLNLNS